MSMEEIAALYDEYLETEGLTEEEYPFREFARDVVSDLQMMHHYGEI